VEGSECDFLKVLFQHLHGGTKENYIQTIPQDSCLRSRDSNPELLNHDFRIQNLDGGGCGYLHSPRQFEEIQKESQTGKLMTQRRFDLGLSIRQACNIIAKQTGWIEMSKRQQGAPKRWYPTTSLRGVTRTQ